MNKTIWNLCTVAAAALFLAACSSQSAYQSQANNTVNKTAMAKTNLAQAERWDFDLPNQEVWKVGYKVQNANMNNFIWIPSGQDMGTWKQNITDKFIVANTVSGDTPKDIMEKARQSSQAQCQHVEWKTLSESDTQIVYEADTLVCGKHGKENQHLVGRIEQGDGGVYSLQYFSVQDILNGHLKQTMLDTVQDAKLVAND